MFLSFPSLVEDPFRITPDPRFLYLSEQHEKARCYMDSVGRLTDGIIIITGEVGSGKTILISEFLANLPSDVAAVEIHQTQITPTQFLQSFLAQLGFKPFNKNKAELLNIVNTFLTRNHAEGKRTVLVLDEAQHLTVDVLEEIRLLSGIETGSDRVLSIIIAGQPELKEKLCSPELEQLAQRSPLRFHLSALNRVETEAYVRHRLAVAGDAAGDVFLTTTFDQIYRYTGGIPRLINTLCSAAMLCASADDSAVVSSAALSLALDELDWSESPASRDATASEGEGSCPDSDGALGTQAEVTEQAEHATVENDALAAQLRSDLEEKNARIRLLEDEVQGLKRLESQAEASEIERCRLEEDMAALSEHVDELASKLEKSARERHELGLKLEKACASISALTSELASKEQLIEEIQRVTPTSEAPIPEAPTPEAPTPEVPTPEVTQGAGGDAVAAGNGLAPDAQENGSRYLISLDERTRNKHTIRVGRLTMGSSPDNDISTRSDFISRHHAWLVNSSTTSIVVDLESTNGTYVNSKRIKRHQLRHGDLITIGRHRYRYVDERPGPTGLRADGDVRIRG